MPSLVKNGVVVDDAWVLVETPNGPLAANSIVPFAIAESCSAKAVWIPEDFELEEHVRALLSFELIAIYFPAFADGRGLSLASLLRTRYDYKGELRAFGDVQPDLTPFMQRSGFTSFQLATEEGARAAVKCLGAVSHLYQASAVDPLPAFRKQRRVIGLSR